MREAERGGNFAREWMEWANERASERPSEQRERALDESSREVCGSGNVTRDTATVSYLNVADFTTKVLTHNTQIRGTRFFLGPERPKKYKAR